MLCNGLEEVDDLLLVAGVLIQSVDEQADLATFELLFG